jgi:hypothetical protein
MPFDWDKSVDAAGLTTGKMAQTRNHCERKLIPLLEERRQWTRYVWSFNPGLPAALRPELPTEIYFVYLKRYYALRYREEPCIWRLCFLWHVDDQEADGGDANGREAAEPNERRAAACAVAAPCRRRLLRGFLWEEFDHRAQLLSRIIKPKIELAISRASWTATRVRRRLVVAYTAAIGETHGPPASLSQLVRGSAQAHAARTRAHLERYSVSLAPGVNIDLYALVHEIDWSSFPFGIREDQLVLA